MLSNHNVRSLALLAGLLFYGFLGLGKANQLSEDNQVILPIDGDLCAIDIDSGAVCRITETDRRMEFSPAASPSGTEIAFVDNSAGYLSSEIYILDRTNGKSRRLTRNAFPDIDPAWSPDGKWLAWARNSGHGLALVIGSPADGRIQRILPSKHYGFIEVSEPTWHPTDRAIAFAAVPKRRGYLRKNVYVLDLESNRIEWIGEGRTPTWSTDGDSLAFVKGYDDGGQDLVVWDRVTRRNEIVDWGQTPRTINNMQSVAGGLVFVESQLGSASGDKLPGFPAYGNVLPDKDPADTQDTDASMVPSIQLMATGVRAVNRLSLGTRSARTLVELGTDVGQFPGPTPGSRASACQIDQLQVLDQYGRWVRLTATRKGDCSARDLVGYTIDGGAGRVTAPGTQLEWVSTSDGVHTIRASIFNCLHGNCEPVSSGPIRSLNLVTPWGTGPLNDRDGDGISNQVEDALVSTYQPKFFKHILEPDSVTAVTVRVGPVFQTRPYGDPNSLSLLMNFNALWNHDSGCAKIGAHDYDTEPMGYLAVEGHPARPSSWRISESKFIAHDGTFFQTVNTEPGWHGESIMAQKKHGNFPKVTSYSRAVGCDPLRRDVLLTGFPPDNVGNGGNNPTCGHSYHICDSNYFVPAKWESMVGHFHCWSPFGDPICR